MGHAGVHGRGLVSIGLPLFIVTMASQNIPGIAVLKVNGYEPQPGPLFAATGLFSVLSAPFGGHAVYLAAITAAMCAGEDAHRDPARRYWSAIVAGAGYIVFGLLAATVTAFVSLAPPVLIQAVAGLALISAFCRIGHGRLQGGRRPRGRRRDISGHRIRGQFRRRLRRILGVAGGRTDAGSRRFTKSRRR